MPRVLLIDDETDVAEPLVRLLERAGARSVDLVATAAIALSIASATPFDIFVSDFDLGPGGPNGVAVMADLRVLYPHAVMVCVSGSPRYVPDWCLFVDKTDTDALGNVISSWSSCRRSD